MMSSLGLFISVAIHLAWLAVPQAAFARSAGTLVGEGNVAYEKEEYDQALAAYEEASVEKPESPYIYLNRGNVYYRKGDYGKATEMFEKAALKSMDLRLEAKARYNLGNCAFREGKRQTDSNLQKALEACQTSVSHYQSALKLAPDLHAAAHNIEVVRLTMKDILDKLKRQEEEAAGDEGRAQEIAERLGQLIDRQKRGLEQSEKLADEKAQRGDSEEMKNQSSELAEEQEAIKEETKALSQELEEQQKAQPDAAPSPLDEAGEHLDRSATEQAVAEERLRKGQPDNAKPSQQMALDELEKALEALAGEQPQDQPQQEEDQSRQQTEQEKQQGVTRQNKTAREILDEEKENRERRQLSSAGSYRPVDKDW